MCSIMYKYLQSTDQKTTIHTVALYCDFCPGQNKNRQMLSMICRYLQSTLNVQTVTITYLLPGHTFMPVDSVHAGIERALKNKTIWASSEWPTLITNARVKPAPYTVQKLDHTFFCDWKAIRKLFFQVKSVKQRVAKKLSFSPSK